MSRDSTQSARELWSQMLDRARQSEWSTFSDPSFVHPDKDAASVRQAFLSAGWRQEEIDAAQRANENRNNQAPETSPGVARHTEFMLNFLSSKIVMAAKRLDVPNRDSVHFAVEPKAGPFVSKINVVMTNQSIITKGSFFTRYCGLIARAYVRTINLMPIARIEDFDENSLRAKIRKDKDLLFYWSRIFISFALTGTHALVPFKPSTKYEILTMEQVAFSMEIFALAHEYGHHVLNHGRSVGDLDEAHREEHEADTLAIRICEQVELEHRYSWIKGLDLPNPYLWSGAGAILLLSSLEIYRKAKDRVYRNRPFDTHPSFSTRSQQIRQRYVLQPEKFVISQNFCGGAEFVMRCVMLELEPLLGRLVPKNIHEIMPEDWEVESFG